MENCEKGFVGCCVGCIVALIAPFIVVLAIVLIYVGSAIQYENSDHTDVYIKFLNDYFEIPANYDNIKITDEEYLFSRDPAFLFRGELAMELVDDLSKSIGTDTSWIHANEASELVSTYILKYKTIFSDNPDIVDEMMLTCDEENTVINIVEMGHREAGWPDDFPDDFSVIVLNTEQCVLYCLMVTQ